VPLFPAVTAALVEQLADEQTVGRGADTDLVFCSRTGQPLGHRNVAQRGVEKAGSRAGLGKALAARAGLSNERIQRPATKDRCPAETHPLRRRHKERQKVVQSVGPR
jgi:hypothetical protein